MARSVGCDEDLSRIDGRPVRRRSNMKTKDDHLQYPQTEETCRVPEKED